MGTIIHRTVIATTWDQHSQRMAAEWISTLSDTERPLFLTGDSWINGYQTVVLVPDGSKEGWEDSDKGDDLRNRFVAVLKADCHWEWVEVAYGDTPCYITRSLDEEEEETNDNG